MGGIKFLKRQLNGTKIGEFLKSKKNALIKKDEFSFDKLNIVIPTEELNKRARINLVIPSMLDINVFGGISTASKIFLDLANVLNVETRIIVSGNEEFKKSRTLKLSGYKGEIVYLSKESHIKIRVNDIFLVTHWTTAYIFRHVVEWQENVYGKNNNKIVYIIQDYEPGFYAWSTEYILAESTYLCAHSRIIAVFNSLELYHYFKDNGYGFYRELVFNPCLNEKLKKILFDNRCNLKKVKRILIYGRPSTPRNAFTLIVETIKVWSKKYASANEWEIVSLGEKFDDMVVGNNVIKSFGKVDLEEYARYMLTSYVGITLMISPHPSYPPLEMASFGMKVITNSYANKDLSNFSKNITSVTECYPEKIAMYLAKLCDGYHEECELAEISNEYYSDDCIKELAFKLGSVLKEIGNI